MAQKLEESAKLLAQGERESAWREMAKQIAHEIKNPLTPMKLSIQFLMRSKENNDADFDKKLEKVSGTLIQQIDTLSSIAT
jgi:nitrogen fixation/metabolism regulation signal transduction histidine kinase